MSSYAGAAASAEPAPQSKWLTNGPVEGAKYPIKLSIVANVPFH
jgi:hypothetical protein